MDKLQVFEERELLGKDFKIYGTAENPLFLARDVAEWIDYDINKVNEMVQLVDDNEKLTETISWSGQGRKMWFLTEDGLYEVLMQSRKPIAKEFKKEVKEILKSIRKHGGYLTPQKIEEALLNPDTIIQLATNLKEERIKRIEAERINEVNKPKVLFAEALEVSSSSILIGQLAKILKQNGVEIGQNRLFEKLRKEGYLCQRGENYNSPTQRGLELKLFEVKTSTVNNPDGSVRVTKTTKVTGKGQIYFINKFKEAA